MPDPMADHDPDAAWVLVAQRNNRNTVTRTDGRMRNLMRLRNGMHSGTAAGAPQRGAPARPPLSLRPLRKITREISSA
jgi:hypothetical protein